MFYQIHLFLAVKTPRTSLTWHGWLQVCLFSEDRNLPGFLTKEEAEEERQQEEARLSPLDNRHERFAESARQEHISESLQIRPEATQIASAPSTRDPRAPDVPAGAHRIEWRYRWPPLVPPPAPTTVSTEHCLLYAKDPEGLVCAQPRMCCMCRLLCSQLRSNSCV